MESIASVSKQCMLGAPCRAAWGAGPGCTDACPPVVVACAPQLPAQAAAAAHRHAVAGGGQLGGQRDAVQLVLLRQQDVAEQDHIALKLHGGGSADGTGFGKVRGEGGASTGRRPGRDRGWCTARLRLRRPAPGASMRGMGWDGGSRPAGRRAAAQDVTRPQLPGPTARLGGGRSAAPGPHLAVEAAGGRQQRLHRALQQGELGHHRGGLGAGPGGQQAILALRQGGRGAAGPSVACRGRGLERRALAGPPRAAHLQAEEQGVWSRC